MPLIDPIALSQALIRHPSVTPDSGSSLDLLARELSVLGFACEKLVFEEEGTDPVPNLYARLGSATPNFCFAGHTDVVPVGAVGNWSVDPFEAVIRDDNLYGRGASDMKSAIAAFVAAVSRFTETCSPKGSISLLITGDEEGPAVNGTKKVLDWMRDRGEKIDYCLVGEPTNPREMGQMIKVGRRGSLHGMLKVQGVQGHVAYPHAAKNPIPDLIAVLAELNREPLDDGNDLFQPSNLEIINVDVGNDSHNVIPAEAHARFNVRFNNEYSPESLKEELIRRMARAGVDYEIDWWVSGDSFLTEKGLLSNAVTEAVKKITGLEPDLSTTGGTSDARFIKDMCPVVEFGLVGATMHKVDEHVSVADIRSLTDIYHDILGRILT